MKPILSYQDTRWNNEDFALTPFLFLVKCNEVRVYGVGICWGWFALSLCIVFNSPKNYPFFKILKK